jgi:carbon storage regulator CsrA
LIVFTRGVGEGLRVGDVSVVVKTIEVTKVALEFDAPSTVPIQKSELYGLAWAGKQHHGSELSPGDGIAPGDRGDV